MSEFKFLIINTKELWEQFQEQEESLKITEKGITLKEDYGYSDALFLKDNIVPVSFDLDACGNFFILDAEKKAFYFADLESQRKVDSIPFSQPKSISLSTYYIYIVDDRKIYCLSRTNYRKRWEKENFGDVRIASAGEERLYILDVTNKKISLNTRCCILSEIKLRAEKGTDYPLNDPVDIASDCQNNIYILEASEKKVEKFDYTGKHLETIDLADRGGPKPLALAVDKDDNIYLYFKGENGIVLLKRKYKSYGIYITKPLDSNLPNCEWHKVILEAEIPENTQIKLSHYISDEQDLPSSPPWSEPPLVNPKDALILNPEKPKGQWIWFRIELLSDEFNSKTPMIKSLRVYYPRISYLRYLPATYQECLSLENFQEDKTSKDFLERFLSLFETFLEGLEAKIEDVPKFLDIKGTPEKFLNWLSTWVGTIRDENWEENKWREFLSRAVQLYKQRGTRKMLSELIRIYTGEEPIIVEHFQLRCAAPELKKGLEKLFGSCPYSFCVLLKPGQVKNEVETNTVKRIIDNEKPAHTRGGLQVLQPWIILGGHTYLEVNTFLSKPEFTLGKAVLSINMMLEE